MVDKHQLVIYIWKFLTGFFVVLVKKTALLFLKEYKIRNDDLCDQCKNPDVTGATFLQCPVNLKFYHEILSWFNVPHNTLRNLSPEQILMQEYIPGPINDTSNAD